MKPDPSAMLFGSWMLTGLISVCCASTSVHAGPGARCVQPGAHRSQRPQCDGGDQRRRPCVRPVVADCAQVFAGALARKRADLDLRAALTEVEQLRDRLRDENEYLKREVISLHGTSQIIGRSETLKSVLIRAQQMAATDATVLLLGEPAPGKSCWPRRFTVQLSIGDDGKGFDLAGARGPGPGLGLVSIDERARLLGGRVQFETRPQLGTCVHVEIPWPAKIALESPTASGGRPI
jgi:hypothetical protein